jgi:PmbA protein
VTVPVHRNARPAGLVGEDRAGALLSEALATSVADDIEISLAARTSSVLRFAGGRVHQPQDLAGLQMMVRAVVGGRSARVATSCPALLADAVRRACEQAAALPGLASGAAHPPFDPGTDPPATAAATGAGPLWFEATEAWDAPRRAAQIAELHRCAASSGCGGGGSRPGGTELAGTLAAGTTELAVVTSRGARRYAAATEASLSLTAQCGAGTSHAEELTRDASEIDVAAIGGDLVAEAVRMVGAEELPAGRYDVVFGPLAAAELIAFLPAFGFTAPALGAGIGVVAAASRRFSPLVTIADDATAGPGLPFPFDFEGVTKQRVELVREGRLGGVVSDLAHAAVTGGSTGHAHIAREEAAAPRAANLRLEAGLCDMEDLVAGTTRGVYIQRLWYTRLVDAALGLITGTTRDAAFEIRDGRLGRPVSGVRFTESVLDALERVDGVAGRITSQPQLNVWNGSVGAPAIRVRGFRLGVTGPAPSPSPPTPAPSGRGPRP